MGKDYKESGQALLKAGRGMEPERVRDSRTSGGDLEDLQPGRRAPNRHE